VPCYNHARWLPAAFASVEAPTMTPREVLLVDDASTDGTWRVMNELQTAGSLPAGVVRLLRNERNVGQCETINRAVQETSANVIVILNDDDYLMHDALASIAGVFARHPAVALVGARALPVGTQAHLENLKKTVAGSLLSSEFRVRISEPATARAYESARQLDMCHSASAFRREAWQAVGGYYPDRERRVVVFSDRDFQLRVNYLYPVAVVENAAFALWRAGSSVDSGRFT
jgi:GT2 family glycosyltransferase